MHRDLDKNIWKEELSENGADNIVLDVRTPEEWDMGVQKNALLIDFFDSQKLLSFIQDLDQSKNYYVYCKAGGRSFQVCQMMQQMGFLKTNNLLGGMMEWDGEVVSK